jgi:hypothetical protein
LEQGNLSDGLTLLKFTQVKAWDISAERDGWMVEA